MRIVHIAFLYGVNNTGGAAIAVTRLHNALLEYGVESYYICHEAKEEGRNVIELPHNRIARTIHSLVGKAMRFAWRFTSYRQSLETNSIPMFGLEKALQTISPDVVHVQWINRGVISFEQLGRLNYPVVVSLHDQFMINILEPYAGVDERFIHGVTKENSEWWERRLFLRKQEVISKIAPVFVGPSKWICDSARKSLIGRGFKVVPVLNVMDDVFYDYSADFACEGRFVLLFGANGGSRNPYKGFDDLMKAVSLLPQEVRNASELWVFGEDNQDYEFQGMRVHFCGVVNSAKSLRLLYERASVFVLSSKLDNAPSTKFEALMTGLPVIAFRRTGCAEYIEHGRNGWVAKDRDCAEFADGIKYFYGRFRKSNYCGLRSSISANAKDAFCKESVVKTLLDVYNSAIEARKETK